MNRVNVLYSIRRSEIYNFYNKYRDINLDNIQDVNDKIVDFHLKKEHFENPLEEFFNITSMCSYMIDNDLYDEYFFETFKELEEDYNNNEFDDLFMNEEDKIVIDEDINRINNYIKEDNDKMSYYDNLTEIYNKKNID